MIKSIETSVDRLMDNMELVGESGSEYMLKQLKRLLKK